MKIFQCIKKRQAAQKPMLSVLIDPDFYYNRKHKLLKALKIIEQSKTDFIFVGGSLLLFPMAEVIATIKAETAKPLILFPGSMHQLSSEADGILFLSLLSGRNPDFLIGNHILSAPFLKRSPLEILPTGYMLIESGVSTSVEYVSQTKPIPRNKADIAVATALAGELLGLKLIYMDAGSGAKYPIEEKMIAQVKQNIDIPLLIGGGLNTPQKVEKALSGGADMVVVGNVLEKKMSFLEKISTFF